MLSTGLYSISIRIGARVSTMVLMSLPVGLRSIVGNISVASLRARVASLDVKMVAVVGSFCWFV